jgi:hypothetical protein
MKNGKVTFEESYPMNEQIGVYLFLFMDKKPFQERLTALQAIFLKQIMIPIRYQRENCLTNPS